MIDALRCNLIGVGFRAFVHMNTQTFLFIKFGRGAFLDWAGLDIVLSTLFSYYTLLK